MQQNLLSPSNVDNDLFLSRLAVQLADQRRLLTKNRALIVNDRQAAQRLQLGFNEKCFQDVAEACFDELRVLSHDPNLDTKEVILRAFWANYAKECQLDTVKARLLINPPAGLVIHDHFNWTFSSFHHTGEYGLSTEIRSMSPFEINQIQGEFKGFFEDATFFADHHLDNCSPIVERLIPGSTVTLFRPTKSKHAFWIQWLDLSFGYQALIQQLESSFKLQRVFQGQTVNVEKI